MAKSYNHKEIEPKWAQFWKDQNTYKAVDFSDKPKKYILCEFPYPSGAALHAGHMMRYTVPDIYARWLRMNGNNVLFPMGWDAFGLPAENYAVKTGIHPAVTTQKAIDNYRKSMMAMGYSVDWDREINTTDPDYYKWTQWLFLKFYEKGLAEYKDMPVWFCENLGTVLSDEEIITDANGNKVSERGEHPVERRNIKQWILKMPEYAEKLLDGLNEVAFSDAVKSAQINWIGKKEGAIIKYKIKDTDQFVECFTTRPDTNFGATFVVLSPEHDFCKTLTAPDVLKYISEAKSKSELERISEKGKKTGVFTGFYALNPLNKKEMPIWISDFVLANFGTGAVVGVPAHDSRDYAFAKAFDLEIIRVVEGGDLPFEEEGTSVNSDFLNGMSTAQAKQTIIKHIEKEGFGKHHITYNLHDWVFSRQRYWGEPIPMVHYENGDIKPVDTEELPVKLPDVPDYSPSKDGTSPLARNKSWVETTDKNGTPIKRETNTMPNWAGSSWYYLRYTDPKNDSEFANAEKLKYWLPVDKYFGGIEHTTRHLLYSRFWHKFFYDIGLVPTSEPYAWRLNGGILLGPDGVKMSKSRGNVVEPMDVVDAYGADTLRMFVSFLGPYDETYPWNENGAKSCYRLIKTLFEMKDKAVDKMSDTNQETQFKKAANKCIKNVSDMCSKFKMNTAVSEFMIFVNETKDLPQIEKKLYLGVIKAIAPFAPFMADEVWHEFGNKDSIHTSAWPTFDATILEESTIKVAVQVNGKVKFEVVLAKTADESVARQTVESHEKYSEVLNGFEVSKFIYIPNRIINIVAIKKP